MLQPVPRIQRVVRRGIHCLHQRIPPRLGAEVIAELAERIDQNRFLRLPGLAFSAASAPAVAGLFSVRLLALAAATTAAIRWLDQAGRFDLYVLHIGRWFAGRGILARHVDCRQRA
jgi:hypothetical protein